ncbi:hypothetical protein AKUG0406_PHAGE200210 (plasmid) [Apilactobacillus kunkeei]|nr:hypothetical protein AKUG0406_PHAGE200210 [Apilactobacillus kunkeei]CAI2677270.1 hypothetical protein AKUG0403_PHAGE200220 [Apilactobacillus kunkeei]CAI2680571.1 hypothetical protein AKUG0420_PHAGE200220 [Apilactobacillus kunkeei]
MLFDYPKIDEYVEKRREEIEHPWIEQDENVGGGKSNKISNPIESMIITIDEDRIIRRLVEQKNAIYNACTHLKPEYLSVIRRYYFYNQASFKTINTIIKELDVPKTSFYRAFAAFKHEIMSNLELEFLDFGEKS